MATKQLKTINFGDGDTYELTPEWSKIQNKPSLVTSEEFTTLSTAVDGKQPKGNYLTAVPSEYVTETELTAKGYLTQHQDISGKADKATTLAGYGITDGATKTELNNLSNEIDDLKGGEIPEYWNEHLAEKIETIKALHRQYGKDCFSFVHIVDMHYPSNLGKRSPLIANKIMDETQIKYALLNGDLQSRGCHSTKEQLMAENELILTMLEPLKDKALLQKGNHDGAYGWLDRDGSGGYNNSDSSGNVYPENERESYVHNLTPQEFHEYCYRKVGMVGEVHFDETGTAYYIDDTANNARFIGLNTQCNDYELQEDGTQKYPTMWLMRFTQPQFDFLINEALINGVNDRTKIVVFGHVPLWQEIGDKDLMCGVLKAYKDKSTYSGTYAGTAKSTAYTNLAEPLPTNTTDTSKWVNNYRISSSGISTESGTTLSNIIPCKSGDTIRIKGVTLRSSKDRVAVYYNNLEGTMAANSIAPGYFQNGVVSGQDTVATYNGLEDGVYSFTVSNWGEYVVTGFRFAMPTPTDASAVVVTVNEEIVEGTASGFDAVSVSCDFTEAKGEFVGYFAGHVHYDHCTTDKGFPIITSRCDAKEENDSTLKAERVAGTITEQSFDVFTVTPSKIYATKIGAGSDRVIG